MHGDRRPRRLVRRPTSSTTTTSTTATSSTRPACSPKADPSSTRVLAPVIDLLAADLATSGPSTLFPQRRTFDPYTGHSWASGFSPFADGNNQESSSEAVNAWNGLALWADATGNAALQTEARWMLSSEIASARCRLGRQRPLASFTGFQHEIVSINWGGKRDYATWFSPDPNAMLGIQLIPMSPVSTYLAGDPARIRATSRRRSPHGFDVQFGDYLLMYSALAGSAELADARAAAAHAPRHGDRRRGFAHLPARLAGRERMSLTPRRPGPRRAPRRRRPRGRVPPRRRPTG